MRRKKTVVRVGPFGRGIQEIHQDDPNDADESAEFSRAVRELFTAHLPAGRIATWRPHAERLGVAGDLLDQAAALIDANGYVDNTDRFDALMAWAQLQIEQAQNEHIDVYGLAGRTARHSKQLSQTANERNESRRKEAAAINAKLIALDHDIAAKHPKYKQVRRAAEIIRQYPVVVTLLGTITPESLAKRIRNARK